MLLKVLSLQKWWFRIPSDPELGSQINDRISFKKFFDLPLDKPSPEHSTFSRLRSRPSSDAMIQINNAVLQEFAKKESRIEPWPLGTGFYPGLKQIQRSLWMKINYGRPTRKGPKEAGS